MKQFYKNHKKEIFLFLLMLFLELAMIFAISLRSEIGIYLRNDANEYMSAVKNLFYRHIFSLDSVSPFLPDNFRTPGYILFLSTIYLVFLSFKPAIFIGATIFALSAPLTYLIGKQFFSEKVAFIGAILFAIEPWAIFQGGFLVAEQIFLPFFLLSIYLFCRYLKTGITKFAYWAFLILGITTLIRPLVTFFVFVFLFFVFIRESKVSIRRVFLVSFLSILIFISILSPWLIRNKIVLNTWQISSISSVSLYIENYMMLERYLGKMGESEDINEKARLLLGTQNYEEAKKFKNAQILGNTAFNEIKSNLGSYAVMHLSKIPLFLLKNSYGNIFFDLKISGADIQSDINQHLSNGDFMGLFSSVKSAPIGGKILIVLAFFWPFIIMMAIIGIFAKFRNNPKDLLFLFLILWIVYFIGLTGNLRDISRYKLAINAPLFMFAVFAIKTHIRTQKLKDFLFFPLRAITLHDRDKWGLTSLASERFGYVAQEVVGYCLDVGCGKNNRFIVEYCKGRGKGIDVFPYEGLSEENVVQDMSRFPFEDASFSSVTFIANLNHVPRPLRDIELKEALRCLQPGGNIIVTMGNPLAEILVHKVVYWHDKIFGTSYDMDTERGMSEEEEYYLTDSEIIERLSLAGFNNISKKYFFTQWGLNHLFIAWKPK